MKRSCPCQRICPLLRTRRTAQLGGYFQRPVGILYLVELRRYFLPRCPLAQRLVRPLQIVIAAPTLQPALLRPCGARNRPRRLGLQLPVHLFVGAIVLRMCWSNKFHLDSQTGPPGTQARQARRPGRSKRPSIVHSNDLGHSIPSKMPDKHSFYSPPLLVGHNSYPQKIAAEQISCGQRFDSTAIGSAPPPFEIHCPHRIDSLGYGQLPALDHRPFGRTSAPFFADVPVPQPASHRSHRGHTLARMKLSQTGTDFLAAPSPVSPPHCFDALAPKRRHSPGRMTRTPRSISQAASTSLHKPRLPLVSRLATHAKKPAQFLNRLLGLQKLFHQAQTPLGQRNNFPRHDLPKAPNPT